MSGAAAGAQTGHDPATAGAVTAGSAGQGQHLMSSPSCIPAHQLNSAKPAAAPGSIASADRGGSSRGLAVDGVGGGGVSMLDVGGVEGASQGGWEAAREGEGCEGVEAGSSRLKRRRLAQCAAEHAAEPLQGGGRQTCRSLSYAHAGALQRGAVAWCVMF